ncbi:Phosphate acetyltransferase [Propionispora sp. 2/2-37]|uniref:phosphate acetyltransferase n=1 Tax=Propionispora sp. 2/2-37 TaxID=1677858 RepID=UPI0006BB876E|nr:phosphate acetyltransferase [Propionispora sp. 2/2-37]CUH97284.1 Phosphate acetyltransferase [Propionispora sp. 2/2-37]
MSFMEQMMQRAKVNKQKIVLPEAGDLRVLKAASEVAAKDIADVILVGSKSEILRAAGNIDLSGVTIIDSETAEKHEEYSMAFYELRKSKGMTLEKARQLIKDPVYYGMMMMKQNDADGLVSGAIHSTADTLRPALQIIKTAPASKLVSTFFVMVIPDCEYGQDGILLFSDCALNENPDAEQLSEIAIASAQTMQQLLGITPVVAMLSYSTFGSARSALTEKVVQATSLAKQKAPGLRLDGELQVDAALVERVARLKAPQSSVAGAANVLIFPDLNAGNIGYKLTERLAKAQAYGPVTQGLAKPINDLSRGCKAEDIVGVVAITAVQAQTSL